MQVSGNNAAKWMQPALDVIKRVEPATYAKMQADHWPVFVVDSRNDLDWVMHDGPMEWLPLVHEVSIAFGVTRDPSDYTAPADLKDSTFLNRPAITSQADDLHVPVADFLADVMVHEFAHRDGGGMSEPEAFRAGTQFARTLEGGDGPIAQLSEATLADYGDDA